MNTQSDHATSASLTGQQSNSEPWSTNPAVSPRLSLNQINQDHAVASAFYSSPSSVPQGPPTSTLFISQQHSVHPAPSLAINALPTVAAHASRANALTASACGIAAPPIEPTLSHTASTQQALTTMAFGQIPSTLATHLVNLGGMTTTSAVPTTVRPSLAQQLMQHSTIVPSQTQNALGGASLSSTVPTDFPTHVGSGMMARNPSNGLPLQYGGSPVQAIQSGTNINQNGFTMGQNNVGSTRFLHNHNMGQSVSNITSIQQINGGVQSANGQLVMLGNNTNINTVSVITLPYHLQQQQQSQQSQQSTQSHYSTQFSSIPITSQQSSQPLKRSRGNHMINQPSVLSGGQLGGQSQTYDSSYNPLSGAGHTFNSTMTIHGQPISQHHSTLLQQQSQLQQSQSQQQQQQQQQVNLYNPIHTHDIDKNTIHYQGNNYHIQSANGTTPNQHDTTMLPSRSTAVTQGSGTTNDSNTTNERMTYGSNPSSHHATHSTDQTSLSITTYQPAQGTYIQSLTVPALIERVKSVLLRDNLKQKDLASFVGISGSTLSPLLKHKYAHTKPQHIHALINWVLSRDGEFSVLITSRIRLLGIDLVDLLPKIGLHSGSQWTQWVQLQDVGIDRSLLDREIAAFISAISHSRMSTDDPGYILEDDCDGDDINDNGRGYPHNTTHPLGSDHTNTNNLNQFKNDAGRLGSDQNFNDTTGLAQAGSDPSRGRDAGTSLLNFDPATDDPTDIAGEGGTSFSRSNSYYTTGTGVPGTGGVGSGPYDGTGASKSTSRLRDVNPNAVLKQSIVHSAFPSLSRGFLRSVVRILGNIQCPPPSPTNTTASIVQQNNSRASVHNIEQI